MKRFRQRSPGEGARRVPGSFIDGYPTMKNLVREQIFDSVTPVGVGTWWLTKWVYNGHFVCFDAGRQGSKKWRMYRIEESNPRYWVCYVGTPEELAGLMAAWVLADEVTLSQTNP